MLHHEIRTNPGFDAEVEDADDMRMTQSGTHPGFVHEASFQRPDVTAARNDFDRDDIAKTSAARAIDLSHTANTDAVFDLVSPVQNLAGPDAPHARILRYRRRALVIF